MIRKLMLVLLSGAICLVGMSAALAQETQIYELKEYEQLTGRKMEFQEAPMLRTKVAVGELPPVEERLPEEPLVIKPCEEIGQYGGTLRLISQEGNYNNHNMTFGYEFLASYSPDMSKIYPNVLKGWKVSEDAKKFTLYLRKGMRWSDGVPFTADDIVFYFEDVALNKDLFPAPPSRFVIGGEAGVVRKIDDYTLEISFKEPYGSFIETLCRWRPNAYLPKHFLKQFHPEYTPMDEIEKAVKKEGFNTWVGLFQSKMGGMFDSWGIPERPVLTFWVAQNSLDKPVQMLVRNPYYWKVDTEGNQLPYIDRVERYLINDYEAQLLKTLAGEIDFQWSLVWGALKNHPIVMENRGKGDYRLMRFWWPPDNRGAVRFNMSHNDSTLKNLFNDRRFRIALSVAINREEINELIFEGQGEPSHPTPMSGPPFYGEKLFKNYLEYDPKLANQLLDEIGLVTKRDKKGYRLRPDGERLRMVNSVVTYWSEDQEITELYKEYWKAIGIEVVNKPMALGMVTAVHRSLDFDIITYSTSVGGRPMNPLWRGVYFPLDAGFAIASQWGLWFATGGEKGDEPPEDLKRMMKIRDEAIRESNEEKRIVLTLEAFEILEENLWMIGAMNSSPMANYWVTQNSLRNVPEYSCCNFVSEVPAQLFIKERK